MNSKSFYFLNSKYAMGFSFHLRAISEIHGQKNIVHARLLRAGITRISTKRCLSGKGWKKLNLGDDFSELKQTLDFMDISV